MTSATTRAKQQIEESSTYSDPMDGLAYDDPELCTLALFIIFTLLFCILAVIK